ncbi:Thiamine-phosphate synthase [Limihaloglobus sulfuriphilus]|uniref:Thiamine-phosphate synthase n=1 Tax=Limihaloglobus sulfuriphilus TaxID=1851148 RepID=A0A1Q2MHX2_9BACT|nr:thiamine phosphate synthase [Limihaloglobus sulfuriphilus]AQQ72305.1 Thiamine-phosphate synthase [Limihaloglobus sulfuriphilus]
MSISDRALWRIIDANFNRAREGLRVMEEYARFAAESVPLTQRIKSLRHRLCAVIEKHPRDVLLNARDTDGDIGAGAVNESQISRGSSEDMFIAAARRVPEALRAITEAFKTIDPASASEIEGLRFEAYKLEKEICLSIYAAGKFSRVRLYVLADPSLTNDLERFVKQCIAGGADCIQLRAKGFSDKCLCEMAASVADICRDAGVLSIINDRADIALTAGADGVHLGLDDMSVSHVRKLSYRPLIVGVTTHNEDELDAAVNAGADYVGLGPAFKTSTKPQLQPAGLDYIRLAITKLKGSGIGHTAIGGITGDNINRLIDIGVKTAAVCGCLYSCDSPKTLCTEFKSLLEGV